MKKILALSLISLAVSSIQPSYAHNRFYGKVVIKPPTVKVVKTAPKGYRCVGWRAGHYISFKKHRRAGYRARCPRGLWIRW